MAIAFDAVNSGASGTGATLTRTHTCTGSDLTLWVSAVCNLANSITGCTYNGVAMTQIGTGLVDGAGNTNHLFYLINPATGTNNVVLSQSGSNSINFISDSYTGCGQVTQPDSSNTNSTGSNSSLTTSTTVIASNCWLIESGAAGTGCASVNTSQSLRGQQNAGSGGSRVTNGIVDSNATVGTGSQSLDFNTDGNGNHPLTVIIASIAPVIINTNSNFLAVF